MTKKIIKYYIILLVIFFSWAGVANAGLEITEINNPDVKANHCWIKIYNNDPSEVNLTGWFVMDDDGIIPPKPWHYHTINADGSSTLAPNSYAIIADSTSTTIDTFKTKNPGITDPIFYGSLTFKDAGTMGLSKDKKKIIGQLSYSGTSTSLNNNSSTNSSEDNTVDETIDPVPLVKEDLVILKITTKITSPKIVTAGIPFSLSSLTTTNRGETYAVGKFVWNFGDGMMREIGKADPFEYTYQYPGDYALTLSYYNSTFSIKPDAVDRITIKVVPAGINISSVGTASDPFVEIENKSSYEIVLSNWVVTAGIHYFIIPEGTTLLPSKKIKLSPKITGFVGEDLNSIVISNGSKEIIATYPIQMIKPIQNKILSVSSTNPQDTPDTSLLKEPQVINLNDLGASAENTGINIPNSTYPLVGLLVVVGLGVASFLLIKKKRNVGDYVEQGISAKDMTIIE